MGWRDKLKRKHKKREKTFVTLTLEKNGELKEVTLKTKSNWNMAKKIKPLMKYARQGWTIQEVSGNDPERIAFFQKIADGHKPGAREMLSHAGLPGMPKRLKKFFNKDGELQSK